tara:strand:- start:2089 stop:2664 length:576 start_codon:yes stop_codon:yes gene_type:complete
MKQLNNIILEGIPDKRVDKNTTSLKFKQDLIEFFTPLKFKTCIEVGTHMGYSARILSSLFEHVITLEHEMDYIRHAVDLNKDIKNIEYLHGNVYESDWGLEGDYDVAFIDCNHHYDFVKKDIESCMKYNVKYIIFDDYGIPFDYLGVKPAVDEFIKENSISEVHYVGEPAGNEPRIGKPLIASEGVILKIR